MTVKPKTEWPLASYGIKPIAKSLGFFWAAEDASGASSIAWYDEYARTGDPSLREKIIDYNRSDCIASAVVLDALIALPVGAPPWPPVAGIPGGSGSETYCVADGDVEEASEEGRPVGSSERSSCPPSEGTGPQLIDEPPVSGHGAGTPGRCRTGTPALVRAVYAAPSLTPCLDPIAPEVDDGVQVGLRANYAALEGELPLAGGDAMRPTPGGGLLLCERLREALPWVEDAISVVERQLSVALWAGRPWLQWRPLCLVGPAGVGKSHLARELGRIAGVGAAQLDLGGTHDSGALAATARGWTNTRPCWPAEMMNAFLCANPVLTLDEIDKAGGSKRNGDPQNAVLAMLEPGTAAVYFDTSLMARVDLSAVCWLATANDADLLPAPLRSRLDIVRVVPPAVEHVDGIVQGILHSMAKRWAMPAASLPEIPPRAMAVLRDDFARHRSVRRLKRHVQDVLAALISLPRGNLH